MTGILHTLTKDVSAKTMLRWYLKTGRMHSWFLREAKKSLMYEVYSIDQEQEIINKNFMMHVKKFKNGEISLAIHTRDTYVLTRVMRQRNKKSFTVCVSEVITCNMAEYDDVCNMLLPNLFIEFIAYGVNVYQAPKCRVTI